MKNKKSKTRYFTFCLLFVFCFLFYVNSVLAVRLETGLPVQGITRLSVPNFPTYIRYLFIFSLSIITFLALAQMIIGGIIYILAAGNVAKIEDAKDTIKQALLGLGLILASYLLLRTINPDLVRLNLSLSGVTVNPSLPSSPSPQYPTVGTPCSPNGAISAGMLLCKDGKWQQFEGLPPG